MTEMHTPDRLDAHVERIVRTVAAVDGQGHPLLADGRGGTSRAWEAEMARAYAAGPVWQDRN